jgi:hypothetical protein
MKFKLTVYLALLSVGLFSQGLYNNGANIVFSGNAQIYIDNITNGNYFTTGTGSITASASSTITLLKDWINNSSNNGFATPDGGGVVLAGNAQSIGGSAATAFHNLTLAGNGIKTLAVVPAVNTTTVGGQAAFTGTLALTSSTLDLNGRRIDITNSAIGAITRSSGYIISETNTAVNPSIIRWYHRTIGGSRVYPFGVAGSYIPFTFNSTTPMSNAAAFVEVSTRATATAFNVPWAGASNLGPAVSQMFSPNGNFPDGSDEVVVDRWWDITNSHPVTADVTFSYRGIENTLAAPYNIGFVGPQYWNGSGWISDNLIIGTGAAVVSGATVGSVSAVGVSTFCPWVLSARLSPLPVELINFDAKCLNNDIILEWCTASEKDNSYFTIEQSVDGVNYSSIGNVFGNGTSNEKNCYQFKSSSIAEMNYFRLVLVDNNGVKNMSKSINIVSCKASNGNILIAHSGTNELGVILNTLSDQTLELQVHNALGQLVQVKKFGVVKGYNNVKLDLENVSNSTYYISIYNSAEKLISKKIIVSDFIR